MRVFFITGVNRGIGLELASQLLNQGHKVYGTAREVNLPQFKDLSEAHSDRFEVYPLEVTDDDSVETLKEKLLPRVSDRGIDVLINNAAILEDSDTKSYEISPRLMMRTFDVNVLGPLRVIKALLPALQMGHDPLIVNISSRVGSITDNTSGGHTSYRVSKTALNMLNKNLSLELSPLKIACVVLHPGWVQTQMGGPNALIDTRTSVMGMVEVMQKLGMGHSGKFYNFKGEELPW